MLVESFTYVYFSVDYQYRTAAQVNDHRTAIGLARTNDVDLRFFLPPPQIPKSRDVSITKSSLFQADLELLIASRFYDI